MHCSSLPSTSVPVAEVFYLQFNDCEEAVQRGFASANFSQFNDSMEETIRQKCWDTTPVELGVDITSYCQFPVPDESSGNCNLLRELMRNTMGSFLGESLYISADGSINNETRFVTIFRLDPANGTNHSSTDDDECSNLPVGLKYHIFTRRNFIVGAGFRFYWGDVHEDATLMTMRMSIDFTDVSHSKNISRFWALQQENIAQLTAWKNILNGLSSIDEMLVFSIIALFLGLVFKPL